MNCRLPKATISKRGIRPIIIDGYTGSNVLTYDDETGTPVSVPGTKPLTSDFQAFHTNDKVTFTNDKDTATPTGVLLQAAAPIAGVALALALAAAGLLCVVLGLRERRRQKCRA